MFCPKCSQFQDTDHLRFCSRCGFGLEPVKELIKYEDRGNAKSQSKDFPIRQKDISIGAGLMFAGGVVAVLWGLVISSGPIDAALSQAFFILGFVLAFILLFFHPIVGTLHKFFSDDGKQSEQLSKRQNGINLGAILMFIGTLKALLIATFLESGSRGLMTLLMMTGGFLILLIVRWLAQALYELLFKEENSPKDVISSQTSSVPTLQLQDSSQVAALPPAHSIPVDDYVSPRLETKEGVESSSVTEETTKFLDRN